MKIKNTEELRSRAAFHVEQDHVGGGYGRYMVSEQRFKGCAIGCLSTPGVSMAEWVKSVEERYGKMFGEICVPEKEQHDILTRDFGMCAKLVRAAEGFFEGQHTREDGSRFVEDFAQAVPEGADIRGEDVDAFIQTLPRWQKVNGKKETLHSWTQLSCVLAENDEEEEAPTLEEVRAETQRFLDWLSSHAVQTLPVPIQA